MNIQLQLFFIFDIHQKRKICEFDLKLLKTKVKKIKMFPFVRNLIKYIANNLL